MSHISSAQTEAPIAVVGAGIVGCSIAYALASRGHNVVVIDKGPAAGAGSTSASSAVVRFSYSTLDAVKLSWESLKLWQRWPDFLGVTDDNGFASFVRTGLLILNSPGTTVDVVRDHFNKVGVPFEELSAADIKDRYPQLDTGSYYPPKILDDPQFWEDATAELGGYITPDAGYIDDPSLAAHNLMVAAQSHGARFRFRTTVTAVHQNGGRVCGLQLNGAETLHAPIVVNAAGPWSRQFNDLAGLDGCRGIGTRPLRQEVHELPLPDDYEHGHGPVAISDSDLGTYFRPHLGGNLIIGGVEPACDPLVWIDDPDDFANQPSVSVWEAQTTRVARRVPSARIPGRPSGLAALYDVGDDWMPIYDKTDLPGFYTAIGTSGHQFKNAPMIGTLMAALIEACEAGHDHDHNPVQVTGTDTGLAIDVGHFSRLRENHNTTHNVLG